MPSIRADRVRLVILLYRMEGYVVLLIIRFL